MDVFSLLQTGKSRGASDLHLVVGSPATFRIDGSLESIDGVAAVTFVTPAASTERISIADNEKAFITPLDVSIA